MGGCGGEVDTRTQIALCRSSNRELAASNTFLVKCAHRTSFSIAIVTLALQLACDGREHAIRPDGAHAVGGVDAQVAQGGDGSSDVTVASDDHSPADGGCGPDQRACSGKCIDKDACCIDKDCGGICQRCALNHACIPATDQEDPNGRCSGTCDAGGACKSKQGEPCTSSSATGCLSGASCVDGVCCSTPGCPVCNHCNLNGAGTCSPGPAGADQGCLMSPQSCSAGCDGAGKCRPAPKDTSCGPTTCTGSDTLDGVPHVGVYAAIALTSRTCDGANAGSAACREEATDCVGYVCADATACKVACAADSDCMLGYRCFDTSCIRKQALGSICTSNALCASSVCGPAMNDPTMRCRECDLSSDTCPLDKPYCGEDGVCHACQAQTMDACNADGSFDCLATRTGATYSTSSATTCNANHHLSCGNLSRCAPWMACVNSACKVLGGRPCLQGADCVTGICIEGICKAATACQACSGHDGDCDSGTYCVPRANNIGWRCQPPGGATCP